MADYEDPGWRSAIRGIGWFLIPFAHFAATKTKRSRTEDSLTTTRKFFVGLTVALFSFLIMVTFVEPWDGGDEGWIPIAVMILGSVCLVAVASFRRRPLNPETLETLASSYRARFFICLGIAEAAALFGLSGVFIGGSGWIYLVGLPFALAGFALIAPTRGNIELSQEQIQGLGSPLSLGQALMDRPPPGRN